MKYAVVLIAGKQYKVTEGEEITVDLQPVKAADAYTFADVLLYVDGDTRKIGAPILSDVAVTGIVVENKKGEKIRVAKFKAKARYRKVIGHRSHLTTFKVEHIAVK